MSVVAEAEIEVEVPVALAFARFCDFGGWAAWMPRAFTPVSGPTTPLAVGDRMTVRLGGALPSRLTVVRCQQGREICWRGGVPGLLLGEHAFVFEALGPSRTRIRSSEPFTGLLVGFGPLARRVEQGASEVGSQMLQAFAAHVA